MKHKVGDTVKIKSIDWFNAQEKDSDGDIHIYSVNNIVYFTKDMSNYCSKEAKIEDIRIDDNIYFLDVDKRCYEWTDDMFDETFDFGQLPIGEMFEYKGHKLKVERESDICKDCYFNRQADEEQITINCINNDRPNCSYSTRIDGNSVIFKEVTDMEERTIKLDIETARKWYNGSDDSLRTLALQAFSEEELTDDGLPNNWEEFCKNYHTCENDSCVDIFSNIVTCSNNHGSSSILNKNLLPNKKYAEGILALCQLTQLRDCYRQGWVPDWKDDEDKYIIDYEADNISIASYKRTKSFLSFQSKEIRDKFLDNFKDLIEQAKEYI